MHGFNIECQRSAQIVHQLHTLRDLHRTGIVDEDIEPPASKLLRHLFNSAHNAVCVSWDQVYHHNAALEFIGQVFQRLGRLGSHSREDGGYLAYGLFAEYLDELEAKATAGAGNKIRRHFSVCALPTN